MSYISKIKSISWRWYVPLAIVALSIFLRTYHFRDWLEFSPDEARDATVISNAINEKTGLPLLGPIAGGTEFHLGPMYYYFEYISARLFGNFPDKLAYPDLFFSILSIPFMFLFLKKYFTDSISLALTGLMSVSLFFVQISRFATNPNSIPFWTLLFLYSLLEMMNDKNKNNYIWPALAGIAAGVGVQLHTFLIFIMPGTAFLVLAYLWFKKRISWKSIFILFALVIILNIPQIYSEIKTNGSNTTQFFNGAGTQSNGANNFLNKINLIVSCQIQSNANFITSGENIEGCGDIFNTQGSIRKYQGTPGVFTDANLFELGMIGSVLFTIVGYFLVWYYLKREKDSKKKNFLLLLVLYSAVSLAVFIPVAPHLKLRYYVILFFVPFFLLGLMLKALLESKLKPKRVIFSLIIVFLIFSNLTVIWSASAAYRKGRASDTENSILGEITPIADYIVANTGPEKQIYASGEKVYFHRLFPAMEYLAEKSGVTLIDFSKTKAVDENIPVVFIAATPSPKYQPENQIRGLEIIDKKQFNKITIYILK